MTRFEKLIKILIVLQCIGIGLTSISIVLKILQMKGIL